MEYGDTTIQNQADLSPSPKIVIGSRDMTAASGQVAYTGIGFKPSYITCIACPSTDRRFSIGCVDGNLGGAFGQDNAATINRFRTSIGAGASEGLIWGGDPLTVDSQYAYFVSFDTDGFTLQWDKTGSPTGNNQMVFTCFK